MSTAVAASASVAAATSAAPDVPDTSQLKLPDKETSEQVQSSVLNSLSTIVNGASAPFCCGGAVTLDSPIEVTLLNEDDGNNKAIAVQAPAQLRDGSLKSWDIRTKCKDILKQQDTDLSALIKEMPRAPFGKGGETVYDTSVRDALQLKADKFELNIPQDTMNQILNDVKVSLQLETEVIAEPYSLNAYLVGGKFAKHKDTPRGDDMLGTLLLCLPSWFDGGSMTVSLGQEEKEFFGSGTRYSWEDKPPPNPKMLNWCAFFADVDHEIHKVTEGIRVTAAFLLRRSDRASASSILPRQIAGTEQAERIKQVLLKGLKNERFYRDGGKVGIPCVHLYTNSEVFPGKKDASQPLTAEQISKLKGRDLMVANAAAAAGLSVHLRPYLGHEYSMDGEGDFPLSKFPNKKKCPRRMDDDKIESFFNTGTPGDPEKEADAWIRDFNEAAESKAGNCEWNAEGYFGNEASYIDFYVKAALVIHVPSHSSSRGVPVQMVPPPKKKRKTAPKISVDTSSSSAAAAASSSSAAARAVTPPSAVYDLRACVNARLLGGQKDPALIRKVCVEEATKLGARLAAELTGASPTSVAAGSGSSSSAWGSLSMSAAAAAPAASTKPAPKKFDAGAVVKRLLKKTKAEVKKTVHNEKKKPYTTISDAVPDEAAARQVFRNVTPTSDTKVMIKWTLEGGDISRWFNCDPHDTSPIFIHPVKNNVKTIFGGKVYAWAAFESIEAKFEKKSNLLTLKVRTFMAGSGRPIEGSDVPPMF